MEFLALFSTPLYVTFSWIAGTTGWLLISLAAVILTAWLLAAPAGQPGPPSLLLIKRRMPFLLDLLTLLMEAGSTFLEALRQVGGGVSRATPWRKSSAGC